MFACVWSISVAGLIAKTDVFKNAKTIWRCTLHSGQKWLENILKSDRRTECLVHHLVTGFGNSASATEPGNMSSFARALSNSPKLRGRFRDAVNKDLDVLCELTQKSVKLCWAQQRFSTITEVLRLCVVRCNSILEFLTGVRAENSDQKQTSWASYLLEEVLSAENLILLALTCEWAHCITGYIKKSDNMGRDCNGQSGDRMTSVSHIAFLARNVKMLREDPYGLLCSVDTEHVMESCEKQLTRKSYLGSSDLKATNFHWF